MINIAYKKGREQIHREFVLTMMNFEHKLQKSIQVVFRKQFNAVVAEVEQGHWQRADWCVDKFNHELRRLFFNYYAQIADTFGTRALDEFRKQFSEFEKKDAPTETFWSRMRRWIMYQAAEKAVTIDAQTKKKVRKIIKAGFDDNLTHVQIAKNIKNEGIVEETWRALMIARTETHTAATTATHEAINSTGVTFNKYWSAAIDDRTRQSHKDAARQYNSENAISMDEYYKIKKRDGGVDYMMYPGDPNGSAENTINCRCVELYITPQE